MQCGQEGSARARRALLARGHEARTQRLLRRVEHVHERTRLVVVERVERRDVLRRAAARPSRRRTRAAGSGIRRRPAGARRLRVAPALAAARERAAAAAARGGARRASLECSTPLPLCSSARASRAAASRASRTPSTRAAARSRRRPSRRAERRDARERARSLRPPARPPISRPPLAAMRPAHSFAAAPPAERPHARRARLEEYISSGGRVRRGAAPAEVPGERVEQVAEVDDAVDCAERAVVEEGLELEAEHAELEQPRELPAALLDQVLDRVHRALLRDLLVERLRAARAL